MTSLFEASDVVAAPGVDAGAENILFYYNKLLQFIIKRLIILTVPALKILTFINFFESTWECFPSDDDNEKAASSSGKTENFEQKIERHTQVGIALTCPVNFGHSVYVEHLCF